MSCVALRSVYVGLAAIATVSVSCSDAGQEAKTTAVPQSSVASVPTSPSATSPTGTAPGSPTTIASSGGQNATLILESDAPTLGSRLVADGVFEGPSAALASDGLIVVSRRVAGSVKLFSFTEGHPTVDTGVEVSANTSISFGPGGDLFTIDHGTDFRAAVVSQFHRNDAGGLVLVTTVSGPITGECGFVVEAAYAGCRNEMDCR